MKLNSLLAGICLLLLRSTAFAQVDLPLYTDSLPYGWQNGSWATVNTTNSTPVHTGIRSIAVTAGPWEALFLRHDAFATTPYASLVFWIHGGAAGGQRLQVTGIAGGNKQATFVLSPLAANTWQRVTIPLSSLNLANSTNFTGFWIQDATGTAQPTFYVDDIALATVPTPSTVAISVNAASALRTIDPRIFGLNTAVWDSQLDTPTTMEVLNEVGNVALRFPGGSTSDEYHWASNTITSATWQLITSFDKFANVARTTSAQVFITTNYGSGTPAEAADWVRYSNITKGYGFKYWEVGNENYGHWEVDNNTRPHDPATYAARFKDYYTQMKAVDPTIKVGAVVITGEDTYANYPDEVVTNPRTGVLHGGWTPVMLATLKDLGITPDFVVYHRYEQNPGTENDAFLLQSSLTWPNDAANLRQQLVDYLGAAAAARVELAVTEHNSININPGKQSTSLVNGLFYADSLGQLMKTEFNALLWWDLRNNQEIAQNNSPSLYGWRMYGDQGMVSSAVPAGPADRYPTFYVAKLMKSFARGGDQVIAASSNYPGLSAYAVKTAAGHVNVLLINKHPSAPLPATITLSGYTPGATATLYSYGKPQDSAAQTGAGSADIFQSIISIPGPTLSYTVPPYSATVIAFGARGALQPPAAPTGLRAVALAQGKIRLDWDDVAGEIGYQIERSPDGTTWSQIGSVARDITTFTDYGLAVGRRYYYRVRAYNKRGNGAYSEIASDVAIGIRKPRYPNRERRPGHFPPDPGPMAVHATVR